MENRRNQHGKRGRRGKKEQREFDHALLNIARVARVVQGGRRFSFRATVAIGNRKGKVGVGIAKGADVSSAIGKAVHNAKKNLVTFSIVNETIPHETKTKFGSAQIIIKPAKLGKGIVAGGALRAIAELGGIKNLTAKSLGSNNKINTARAMLKALSQLKIKKDDHANPSN
ncbi:MAG: 30S ribosomal protein S5 [Candidatus Moranbacteria bacterium]|nr:30S ribosomal protein S5 [Candidatus Moranbacteria bacterium]